MTVPPKSRWKAVGSGENPGLAVDDRYATTWVSKASKRPWLKIDLGEVASLGGLEVYWGKQAPEIYRFTSSLDGKRWTRLCATRHGEGGQNVFAFPPTAARFVRWSCDNPEQVLLEIVEINLYAPADSACVLEKGRVAALGRAPVKLRPGESITVDFGYVRSPLGALIAWGKTYGVVFSVHLSDDGANFREMGRIATGDGGSDSFWWRNTTSRFFRFTVHETNSPEGAVVNELKLRILNKDRMPIGQLERAAAAGRGELYPQSLLGRQVYWTALGEFDQAEEALFDEYGNLEPQKGSGQITPLLRLDGVLHGAPDPLRLPRRSSMALCRFRPSPGLWAASLSKRRRLLEAAKPWWNTASPTGAARETGDARARRAPGPGRSLLATWRPRRHHRPRRRGRARYASTIAATPRFRANPILWRSPSLRTETS